MPYRGRHVGGVMTVNRTAQIVLMLNKRVSCVSVRGINKVKVKKKKSHM